MAEKVKAKPEDNLIMTKIVKAPQNPIFQKAQRRASTGSVSTFTEPPKERPIRRSSITFADTDEVYIVPRVEESQIQELFYQENEMWSMRCDAKMEKAGMDPEIFDWRSMR
jgi:hypothetical protein